MGLWGWRPLAGLVTLGVFSRKCVSHSQRWLTDVPVAATFGRLEVAEEAPVVGTYLTNGFIIRGNMVHGSVALLPRGVFNWKVAAI